MFADDEDKQKFPEMMREINRVRRRVQEYRELLVDYGLRDWQVVHSENNKEQTSLQVQQPSPSLLPEQITARAGLTDAAGRGVVRQPFELFHRLVQQGMMLVFYTLFLSIPGILASPVYFLARWYAERQVRHNPTLSQSCKFVEWRNDQWRPKPRTIQEMAVDVCVSQAVKAVAGSSVKLEGKDVLATYKVLTWMWGGPIIIVLYSCAAAYLSGETAIGVMTMMLLPFLGQQAMFAAVPFILPACACQT